MDKQRQPFWSPSTEDEDGLLNMMMLRGLGPLTTLSTGLPFPEWAELSYIVGPIMATASVAKPISTHEVYVDVRLQVEDGEPVVTVMTLRRVKGGAITSALVKGLSMSRLTHMAIRSLSQFVNLRSDDSGRMPTAKEYRDSWERVRGSRAHRPITDALLAQVVNIYNANKDGGSPTVAVAEQLYTSHRTATRWVQAARDKGLLPPYDRTNNNEGND
jgi:hypothetical protein